MKNPDVVYLTQFDKKQTKRNRLPRHIQDLKIVLTFAIKVDNNMTLALNTTLYTKIQDMNEQKLEATCVILVKQPLQKHSKMLAPK